MTADCGKRAAFAEAGVGKAMLPSLDANIAQPKGAGPNPMSVCLGRAFLDSGYDTRRAR